MYFTVYKTTNLINGKIYVGVHKTDNLEDEYLGSGLLLNRAIEKYGKENFSKDIIAICDTEEEMYKLEEDLVCQAFLTFFSTYNMKLGGEGGFDYVNKNKLSGFCDPEVAKKGRKLTDEILRSKGISKRDLAIKGAKASVDRKVGIHNPNYKHKTGIIPGIKTRLKMRYSHLGKHTSDKNSQYGTIWITNSKENKKIKSNEEIPLGWRKGRIVNSGVTGIGTCTVS